MSLHAAFFRAPQTGSGQKRSPCAGCMIRIHSFAEPNFDFVIRFFAPFWCRVFSSWTAQIVLMSFFLSVLLVSFPFFSVLTVLMRELKKIKNDFPFLKNPFFLPYQLHVIFPYALYMSDFLFYRSQVERETFCSSFSSLNSYMSGFLRYSKKCKKSPENAETTCFRRFSGVGLKWKWR